MADKMTYQLASTSNQQYREHKMAGGTLNTTKNTTGNVAKNTANHFAYFVVPYPDMLLVL